MAQTVKERAKPKPPPITYPIPQVHEIREWDRCFIKTCKSRIGPKYRPEHWSLYVLPKETERRRRWFAACNLDYAKRSKNGVKICSLHFKKNDFYYCEMTKRRELKMWIKNLVPVYNLGLNRKVSYEIVRLDHTYFKTEQRIKEEKKENEDKEKEDLMKFPRAVKLPDRLNMVYKRDGNFGNEREMPGKTEFMDITAKEVVDLPKGSAVKLRKKCHHSTFEKHLYIKTNDSVGLRPIDDILNEMTILRNAEKNLLKERELRFVNYDNMVKLNEELKRQKDALLNYRPGRLDPKVKAEIVTQCLSPYYASTQIKAFIRGSSGCRAWTNEEIEQALGIYTWSWRGYNYLRDTQKLLLPQKQVLIDKSVEMGYSAASMRHLLGAPFPAPGESKSGSQRKVKAQICQPDGSQSQMFEVEDMNSSQVIVVSDADSKDWQNMQLVETNDGRQVVQNEQGEFFEVNTSEAAENLKNVLGQTAEGVDVKIDDDMLYQMIQSQDLKEQ